MAVGPWIQGPDLPISWYADYDRTILARGEDGFWDSIVGPVTGTGSGQVAQGTNWDTLSVNSNSSSYRWRFPTAEIEGSIIVRMMQVRPKLSNWGVVPPDVVPPGATVEYESEQGTHHDLSHDVMLFGSGGSRPGIAVEGSIHVSHGGSDLSGYSNSSQAPMPAAMTWGAFQKVVEVYADPDPFTTVSVPFVEEFTTTAERFSVYPTTPEISSGAPPYTGPVTSTWDPPGRGITLTDLIVLSHATYTPPRYRFVTRSQGVRSLRQRQTLPGNTASWPLRQRHNGGANGSWPLRQRQNH